MNQTQSFKFAPAVRTETVVDKIIKWFWYAILFAVLLWPALFVIGFIIAIGLAVLALVVGLSIVLLPVAILLRVLRLV